ncbi:hypothetical protein AB835_00255 [Candidatus Endobugula sertula]|uniref:BryX n=1 Tax=Candidatus Endobugula sertula TaxID=62101 RepID=A0MS27_9GAMM|nr:BryX [Candidatus Endobugula sertula]ODS25134.1 hypothetical protein AB835_00255 [Candidatus Endobugula sertula]
MLEVINRYCHGYVFVPVVLALEEKGFFDLFTRNRYLTFEKIKTELNANSGHLQVALRMLQSVSWISCDDQGYVLTDAADERNKIPSDFIELFNFSMSRYLENTEGHGLKKWIDQSGDNWGISNPVLTDFLDGVLIIPLLLELKENGYFDALKNVNSLNKKLFLGDIEQSVRNEIITLFKQKNWLREDEETFYFTKSGQFITQRIFITATIASYKPMLSRITELMFGNARSIFKKGLHGEESHVDRTLNVIGSGFQHQKYFADIEALVIQLFNDTFYDQQPKYIADMGCGDGTLLKNIYNIIKEKSARGNVLNHYPVVLIGIDYNEAALQETNNTLAGVDTRHYVLKGDIGDPEGVISDLYDLGIKDPENILHVRSFLDHDRPYIAPTEVMNIEARSKIFDQGVYVDSDGQAISPVVMIQSLVEHFKRWSCVKTKHGLLILEVHSLNPEVVNQYLDESESLHFDAYHGFSSQYLVSAEDFLICAAEAGLFSKPDVFQNYPRNLPFTRITLNFFEKKPYQIRHPNENDLSALMDLEKICRPNNQCLCIDDLRQRIDEYPKGQCILELNNTIVAVIYSQKCINRVLGTAAGVWQHNARGQCIHYLYINVLPKIKKEYAIQLLQFTSIYHGVHNDIEDVIGIDECYQCLNEKTIQAGSFMESESVDVLCSRVEKHIAKYPIDIGVNALDAEQEMGLFGAKWLLSIFQSQGVMKKSGEYYQKDQLRLMLNIIPKYYRLFECLLLIFEKRKLISIQKNTVQTLSDIDEFALNDPLVEFASFKRTFSSQYGSLMPFLRLMASCLSRYLEILTGKIQAHDIIFPEGGMNLFEGIFKGDQLSDYFNHILAELIYERANALSVGNMNKTIRILEIGAGTGGATEFVLNRASPLSNVIEFYYTDISSSFLRYGESRFSDKYPWLQYKVLDIESNLDAQGFYPDSFDIVYASNVLHDTKYIQYTLSQVSHMLTQNGLLMLNEFTRMKDLLLFTGGLLDGLWLYEDPTNRLDNVCLLNVDQWRSILFKSGFKNVKDFVLPFEKLNTEQSQSVIVSEWINEDLSSNVENVVKNNHCLEIQNHSDPITVENKIVTIKDNTSLHDSIEKIFYKILGDKRKLGFSPKRPLMELGLDSIELLELRSLLGKHFSIKLEPTFLFQYETMAAVIEYFRSLSVPSDMIQDKPDIIDKVPITEEIMTGGTSRVRTGQSNQNEPIAIIGMSCLFPGEVTTVDEFWELLIQERHAIQPLPKGRWQWPEGVDPSGAQLGIDQGGFLDGIDTFDADFFRISRKEAELMDPQQRKLLELSWQVIEHAGYKPSVFSGQEIGIYVGACHGNYRELLTKSDQSLKTTEGYLMTGSMLSFLPNRISYFYNFKGPSVAIDTACSSVLVAIEQAVYAIQSGRCDQALVGGINLMSTPSDTVSYYQAGMLSKSGKCKTFDAMADGYVRGEGGAMLFLKSLSQAEYDKDCIYGVIKGVGVNHGGQASSLTVPKPDSQAALLKSVYLKANVHPDTISYIETHGTATPLGDPVEVNALKQAFGSFYPDMAQKKLNSRYCGLGSVKTNIGHLEAASGIAGIIKILLSMRYRRIPASLNYTQLNPNIELSDSPFYIVNKSRDWPVLQDSRGGEIPRRAGVNVYGGGGVNAHVVLEEYVTSPDMNNVNIPNATLPDQKKTELIILSAMNEETLKHIAKNLKSYLSKTARLEKHDLADIAYTLQVGREAMKARAIFLVDNNSELIEKLEDFVVGKKVIKNHYAGYVSAENELIALFDSAEDKQQTIKTWMLDGQFEKLARLWVKGLPVDWSLLHDNPRPNRIALPCYPFAKETYWIPAHAETIIPHRDNANVVNKIHPLLHTNISDFTQQCFVSTFTGYEVFFKDHVIQGKRILPGVAYLEMARAAIEQSVGPLYKYKSHIQLQHIAWATPFFIQKKTDVYIHLFINSSDPSERVGNNLIQYEIYTKALDNEHNENLPAATRVIHHHGVALLRNGDDDTEDVNITELTAEIMLSERDNEYHYLDTEKCYALFKNMGIDYGSGHKGIQDIYANNHQVLARLVIPASVLHTQDQFIMPPSLMDSALQAHIGLESHAWTSNSVNLSLYVPFAVDTIDVIAACTANMWVWIRYCLPQEQNINKPFKKLNMDLCDDKGKVCIKIRGLSLKRITGYYPHWQEQTLPGERQRQIEKEIAVSSTHLEGDQLPSKVSSVNETELEERVFQYFKTLISSTLKRPRHRIQLDEALENYGIDSLLSIEMIIELEKVFGSLPKTLFFEYQTIRELGHYFFQTYTEQWCELFRMDNEPDIIDDRRTIEETKTSLTKASTGNLSKHITQRNPYQSRFIAPPVGVNTQQSASVSTVLDVAIIGLSGRYPQAENMEKYWQNLCQGKDCITEIPKARWDWRDYYTGDPDHPGRHHSKWGGFIEDIEQFDALFFNISPREAERIDPQERLFLETSWTALEDAGYCRDSLDKSPLPRQVGVYVGVMYSEYQLLGFEQNLQGNPISSSISHASIANRVSYVLNVSGPSMAVDTMCSSSLTALHLACQDLTLGHTDMGIAGGVNISIHPDKYQLISDKRLVSSSAHCKSFGNGGDGYIPSEGVGAIILKRLADAERDGDHIYGVIKGSAINHGGKTNGYSVPNPDKQQRVISEALQRAQIAPHQVSYVEAHGAGSRLGDPIEITALSKAFNNVSAQFNVQSAANQSCFIGSVKSNIGNCESAAGTASISKVLLQMKHGQIVPSLHSKELNPNIDFSATPFVVNQELRDWQRPLIDGKTVPRVAGVFSFGAGGSNAYVVIEEYIAKIPTNNTRESINHRSIIPLSARTAEQLRQIASRLLAFIEKNKQDNVVTPLIDIAYTLQVGREAMDERLGFIVSSTDELVEELRRYLQTHDDMEELYRGQVNRYEDTFLTMAADEDLSEAIHHWIKKRKLSKLMQYWIKGLVINWDKLYEGLPKDDSPRRISLPTYPFARQYCWIVKDRSTHTHCDVMTSTKAISSKQLPLGKNKEILKNNDSFVGQDDDAETTLTVDMIRHSLRDTLADELYVNAEQLKDDMPFVDMGLDSIVGVTWTRKLSQKYHVSIDATKVYQYPSLRKMANYILAEINRLGTAHLFSKQGRTASPQQKYGISQQEDNALISSSSVSYIKSSPIKKVAIDSDFDKGSHNGRENGYRIISATQNDITELLQLENVCLPQHLVCTRSMLVARIKLYPEGQILIKKQKKIIAALCSQRLDSKTLLYHAKYHQLLSLHHKNGAVLHIVSINILPEFRGQELERKLLNALLYQKHFMDGIQYLTRIISCENYHDHTIELKDYLQQVAHNDWYKEPVLNFHHSHGGRVVGLIRNYQVLNRNSQDDGVLIEHTIKSFSQSIRESFPTTKDFEKTSRYQPLSKRIRSLMRLYPEIVPLSIEGSGCNTFWIHGGSGEVGVYMDIAKHLQTSDFKMIGIQARGFLMPNAPPLNNLVEMARYYSKMIVSVDPIGPYHIIGFSMGGAITYEVGRQLQLAGKTVNTLVMVEPPVCNDNQYADLFNVSKRENFLANANFLLLVTLYLDRDFSEKLNTGEINWDTYMIVEEDVLDIADDELVSYLVQLCLKKGIKQSAEALEFKLRSISDIHLANLQAIQDYRPKTLPYPDKTSIVLMRTESAKATSDAIWNPEYLKNIQRVWGSMMPFFQYWDSLIPNLKTIIIGGNNHVDMLNDKKSLNKFLQQLRQLYNKHKSNNESCDYFHEKNNGILIDRSHTESNIAIIGMSGCFPDAKNVNEFWENLKNARHSVKEIPYNRSWDIDDYFDTSSQTHAQEYVKQGAFLENIDLFDPLFFNISPVEAELMDPTERFFLQESWKAIEDAGYDASNLSGKRWGVFACAKGDYHAIIHKQDKTRIMTTDSMPPARFAYLLNLLGPAVHVDTACSSSLAAIAYACDSLILGNCDVAIAGGGNINSTPSLLISSSQLGLLSKDGRCYTFDQRANGTVLGEAVASIILKPLQQAIDDGDQVYGLIKGWGMNQDGKTNGITAPSVKSQIQLEADVYQKFMINPEHITMVEAHGTGTKLGDPIEVQALTEAFQKYTQKTGYCALGSLKSNIGHTFSAAGVASVIKVLLSFKHSQIPPSINFKTINSHIPIDKTPFFVNSHLKPWPYRADQSRCAAVSAFGATGTNVHLVIEEYISKSSTLNTSRLIDDKPLPVIIPLSAKDPDRLKEVAQRLLEFIREHSTAEVGGEEGFHTDNVDATELQNKLDLQSVAYTLQVGRQAMTERLGFIVSSFKELEKKLDEFMYDKKNIKGMYRGKIKDNEETITLFSRDKEMIEVVKLWMRKKKLSKILNLWVKGLTLDWKQLYGKEHPARISLPCYPFAKERYWLDTDKLVDGSYLNPRQEGINTDSDKFDEKLYESLLDNLFSKTMTPDEAIKLMEEEVS